MVSWYADGGVSGFWPSTSAPTAEAYLLASNGTVDTQGVTRLQYSAGEYDDRIDATARINVTQTDFDNNYARNLGVTMFVVEANLFAAGKIPTPKEILALGTQVRAFRSSRITTTGQHERVIKGPRASTLQANTKYWVLVLPTSWSGTTTPSVANDRPMYWGGENTTGRAVSMWTNRSPGTPKITSPATGTVVPAGTEVTFSFDPSDPDTIFGGDDYSHDDLAGVQVQYAARPTAANPNPEWRDLPIAELYGAVVPGRGWYIDWATVHNGGKDSGTHALWSNRTMKIRCGSNTLKAGMGILPSGDWQIRIRTFDWGHPYPGSGVLKAFTIRDGSYTPDTAPASNTSPWSTPVTISVSAQVPPPIPMSPIGGAAISEGQQITLSWQYRNTAQPAYAQASRTVQIRKVGEANWTTLVSGNSSLSTHAVTGYTFTTPTEYEWRVQVTDTAGVLSDYSQTARFWMVPAPASGPTRPLPSETVEGATLGCGKHRVYVYRRGGMERVGELTELSYVDWGRLRDDISTAKVTISGWSIDCGNLLSLLEPWAYELVIFRDNGYGVDRVWEGPITLLTYERDKVSIDAKDVMAYAYRRIIKQQMNDRGDTVTNRASRVLQNAFAPDDPNVLRYLTVLAREDDAKQYRSLPPYSRTAFEEVDDMAANAGLDYCAVGRSILLWGTKHRIGTLPEFRDEDLGAPPIVSIYGMSMANRYAVSDGNGVYGEANRLDADGRDPIYGLIEMLSSTWASDTPEDTGTYTQEGLATVRKSFGDFAERSISDRYPSPVVVRVPDNTTLNPGTVLSIQQLVPGVVIPLRSVGTLRKVYTSQKLDSVKVVEQNGTETISVTMSAFSRDDAALVEGE